MPICGQCVRTKRYCDHDREIKFRPHGPPSSVQNDSTVTRQPVTSLKDPEIARLFHHYGKHLAPWYDLSDSGERFAKVAPHRALSHPLLFNAIIASAAIHLSTTTTQSLKQTGERYHSGCVESLIGLKDDAYFEDGTALAAVCLLRSYEILAEEFDPIRHLSGAYALSTGSMPSMITPSLLRARFFNYLCEYITCSLINRCALQTDLGGIPIPDRALNDEDQLNVATLHLASAINRILGDGNTVEPRTEGDDRFSKWRDSLPEQFTPYYETPMGHNMHAFQTIRMLWDCPVAVSQHCLLTECVLSSPCINVEANHDELQRKQSEHTDSHSRLRAMP